MSKLNKYYILPESVSMYKYIEKENTKCIEDMFDGTKVIDKVSQNLRLAIAAMCKDVKNPEGFDKYIKEQIRNKIVQLRTSIDKFCEADEARVILEMFFLYLNEKDRWNYLNR